jgi:RNA polymerase sigma-70 factor, ECF subfamily
MRTGSSQRDWAMFVELYAPLLYLWSRHAGFPYADASDLVQEVFAHLLVKLRTFVYDPSQRFRGWLYIVWLNKARELRRKSGRSIQTSVLLDEDPVASGEFEEWVERDYATHVVRRAAQIVRSECSPTNWQAFWETTANGRSGEEVARELGISINAVYQAKSRLLRRLRAELRGLID